MTSGLVLTVLAIENARLKAQAQDRLTRRGIVAAETESGSGSDPKPEQLEADGGGGGSWAQTWSFRAAFLGPALLELVATPLLFVLAAKHTRGPLLNGRLVLAGLLGMSSALLFWFLGTKLRRVRAQEVRALYSNYAAFVLTPYRDPSAAGD